MRKRLALKVSFVAVLLAGSVGVAAGEVITVGNLRLTIDGGFKPKQLPRKELAPISINFEADLETIDGSHPPASDRVLADFDKNGTVYTRGLPTCSTRELENTLTQDALRKCKDALVGRGHARAIIDFPDQAPFDAAAPLLAFNGKPKGRNPVIIFHAFAHVPAPTTFVVPAVISDAPGKRFGKRVKTRIPPIAGGAGSLIHVDLVVERSWKHRGKERDYLLARCATGRFIAKGYVTFVDGTRIDGTIVRPCKPKG
jgi:hypothetical protein